MNGENFVIIGSNGQLGKALQTKYPNARAVDSNVLDISDIRSVDAFDWTNVTHILNAAAYTNVDGAETAEGRIISWQVNASGAGNLSTVCQKHGLTLVHISSDYVFDGTKETHNEYEALSPLSVYGATKAAGDLLAKTADKHYIIRTSWVIGDGKNFVRTMMDLASKNISPSVVHDQIGRLTFTADLVNAIDYVLSNKLEYGTYNVSNDGAPASWADITRKIFAILGRNDLTVTNTSTAEYFAGKQNIARRPLNSTLDLTKIQSAGFKPNNWEAELEHYIKGGNS